MTSPKPIFERCKTRAESSAMAGCCCAAMPPCRRLRWTMAALAGLLVLSSLARAQTTLRTPAADDPQCVENGCPAEPANSGGNTYPTPGRAGSQAATPPLPAETRPNRALQNDEEQGQYGEPARHPKRPFPWSADAIPEPPPNEFQEFVASSVGRGLPIYGQSLFDRVPTTFAPVDRIPVTDDYQIGPGDEILIRAWGQIDLNAKLVVDRGGEVFLPKVGTLSVAGLKYRCFCRKVG